MEVPVPDLTLLLDSPVMLSSLENWSLLMDTANIWKYRVKNGEVPDQWNETIGWQITGGQLISETIHLLYLASLSKKQPKYIKTITKTTCNNYKFSNLLRFVRNVAQHAHDSMSDFYFGYFFPEFKYKNKSAFIQYLIDWVPHLLIVVYGLEKQQYYGQQRNVTISIEYFRHFEQSLRAYSDRKFLLQILEYLRV